MTWKIMELVEAVIIYIYIYISHHLHSCTLVTFKQNTCVRLALLLVFSLTLLVCLARSMLMALMALLGSVPLATIQLSQSTLFLMAHRQ